MAISNIESGLPFEATRDSFKWFVDQTGDCVYPDGDWPPLLLLETAEVIKVVPLGHFNWSTEQAKDYLAQIWLPSAVRQEQARRVGLALHVQDASGAKGDEPREEAIALLVLDHEHCETWFASVKRRPKQRPKLGPWVCHDDVDGRFIEPLRQAVCLQG